SRYYFNLNILDKVQHVPIELEKRTHDVESKDEYELADTVIFHYSSNLKVENINGDSLSFRSDFGNYYAQAINNEKENSITYIRRLRLFKFKLPAERYKDLRSFYAQIVKADNAQAVLLRK